MIMFLKTLTEILTIKKTSNMVYVNEKVFYNKDVIYTVEKVVKSAIQW